MVLLLAKQLNQDSNPIVRFKAPRGLQFLVEAILITNLATSDGFSVVLDYLVEDEVVSLGTTHALVLHVTDTIGNMFISDIDHKTKYLTFGVSGTSNVSYFCVYGKLIPLSKVDALWEWFRKGR